MNLKPCPFCGSDMSSFDPSPEGCGRGDGGTLHVCCDCDVMGPGRKTVEAAIEAWNARADVPRERALLERIANANVIFPSMCANNSEAYTINNELTEYRTNRTYNSARQPEDK